MNIPFKAIKSTDDVKRFFTYLMEDLHLIYHPDFQFEDYVGKDSTTPVFLVDECTILNRLMDECFDVCEICNADIYSIALEADEEYRRRHPHVNITHWN